MVRREVSIVAGLVVYGDTHLLMASLSSASGFLWYCKAVVRFLASAGFSGPYYPLPSSRNFDSLEIARLPADG